MIIIISEIQGIFNKGLVGVYGYTPYSDHVDKSCEKTLKRKKQNIYS